MQKEEREAILNGATFLYNFYLLCLKVNVAVSTFPLYPALRKTRSTANHAHMCGLELDNSKTAMHMFNHIVCPILEVYKLV